MVATSSAGSLSHRGEQGHLVAASMQLVDEAATTTRSVPRM